MWNFVSIAFPFLQLKQNKPGKLLHLDALYNSSSEGDMLVYRRWRTRVYVLLSLVLVFYLLRGHVPSPPQWQNDNRANRKAPQHETQEKPNFLYHSRFRRHPDADLETSLETVLIGIESTAPPLGTFPVKRIWQTARSSDEI